MSEAPLAGIHSMENHPPYKNLAFTTALQAAENAGKVGYDLQLGWFPHLSVEGGTRTIGYGHKMSEGEDAGNYVKVGGERIDFEPGVKGVPDSKIMQLFREDVQRAWATARSQWNRFHSDKVYFDDLHMKYQCILTDLVFNIGTLVSFGRWGWPNLAEAIINSDDPRVREESLRFYTNPAGKKIPLTERRDMICNAVGIHGTNQ